MIVHTDTGVPKYQWFRAQMIMLRGFWMDGVKPPPNLSKQLDGGFPGQSTGILDQGIP